MTKAKKKTIASFIIAVIVVVGLLYLIQLLVMPKYMGQVREGALIAEYYNETTDHDVIFIGDCEVYENFSPITLWEEYGITSYIRGSAQQLIWKSYYLLEETLMYEKPKVIVFNVFSMIHDAPQSEAYNRMTLDGMRLSPVKIEAIKASMTDEENLFTYIFPLFRYHSRWSELTTDDFRYMFKRQKISHNGYLMRADVKPGSQLPAPPVLSDYTFGDACYEYLDKMTELCKENGIELILIKSPSVYPHWYDEWDEQIVCYAQENDLDYINFLDTANECGIDMSTDTYDSGLHLNLSGAEKLSKFFGQILKDKYCVQDHRSDEKYSDVWSKKVDFYYQMKAEQEAEIEKYGYLKSLTVDFEEEK